MFFIMLNVIAHLSHITSRQKSITIFLLMAGFIIRPPNTDFYAPVASGLARSVSPGDNAMIVV